MKSALTILAVLSVLSVPLLAVPADNTVSLSVYDVTDGRFETVQLAPVTNRSIGWNGSAWAMLAGGGGGSVDWGAIGGTLADQADLVAAFAALNASSLTSGTVPDARFPATLPALSGVNLTALNGTNITSGTVAEARIAAALARLASPTFTGTPAAPTAAVGTSTTQLATTAFVQEAKAGAIVVFSDTGPPAYYNPTADTDAARGTALRTAVIAATTGQTVVVRAAATYALGDNGITLQRFPDNGVNLVIGPGVVVTSTQDLLATGVIVEPGINSIITGGGKIHGTNAGAYQAPIGVDEDTGGAGTTGIVIDNVTLEADTDGVYLKHDTEAMGAVIRNCTIITKYDAVICAANSTGAAHRADVYNCRIVVTGPSVAALGVSRGVVAQHDSVVRVFGGSIAVADGGATVTAGAATLQGGTVEVYGTRITVSSADPKYDLYNPAGTLKVAGGSGSGTNGIFLTSGTITYTGPENATNLAGGTVPAARMPALTGDITTSAGAVATTLATVNGNVGSFGSSTSIPSLTVNAKGLVTAASGNAVVAPAGTLSGATLASGVTASSLTSLGTQAAHLLFADNTYDIGASGATRPRRGYFGTGVTAPEYALASGIHITTGTGTPESAVTASVGALYLRNNGGDNSTLYIKASGAGNTGWLPALTSASGTGDFSSNTGSSVDGEIVIFSGTGGKTGKRATGTGVARIDSGVLGTHGTSLGGSGAGDDGLLAIFDAAGGLSATDALFLRNGANFVKFNLNGITGENDVALTLAGLALLDDANAAAQRTTLGLDSTKTGSHASPSTSNPLAPTWSGPTHVVWYGATGEIDLPAASGYAERGIIIYNTGAFTVTIDPNGSEVIVRDGTVQTGGVTMTLSSGAGNYVALICDGTRWVTLGYKGTLAAGS